MGFWDMGYKVKMNGICVGWFFIMGFWDMECLGKYEWDMCRVVLNYGFILIFIF